MKRVLFFSVLALVALLSASCTKVNGNEEVEEQYSIMKLLSNTDDGLSIEFENIKLAWKRKPLVNATMPAVVFDDTVNLDDFRHEVAVAIGTRVFPCKVAVNENPGREIDGGREVILSFSLTYDEVYDYQEYKQRPSVYVKLLFDNEEVHSMPLKMDPVTNECVITAGKDGDGNDILYIDNVQDVFDQAGETFITVPGLGTVGFMPTDTPPVMGCPGFEVMEGETSFSILASALANTEIFYISWRVSEDTTLYRMMYWSEYHKEAI